MAAGFVFGAALPAGAQTGYDEGEIARNPGAGTTLLVDASSGSVEDPIDPGQVLRFRASGFAPESDVTIELRSEPVVLLETRADRGGSIDVDVQIPEDTELGTHHLVAKGVNADGDPHEVSVELIIGQASADGGSDGLPFGIALGTLGVLVLGAFLVTRRRRQHVVTTADRLGAGRP